MISDQLHHFFQTVIDRLLCICYSVHTETEKCAVVLPHLPVTFYPHDISQTWISKRGDQPASMKVQQSNKKIIMLEVKFELKVNRVMDKRAECGNVDAAAI